MLIKLLLMLLIAVASVLEFTVGSFPFSAAKGATPESGNYVGECAALRLRLG